MKIFASIKNCIRNKFRKTEAAKIQEENSASADTKEIFIGVDTGKPENSVGMQLNFQVGGKVSFSPVNLFKFETFSEAKKFFKDFCCDRSCNPVRESTICLHVFEFKCPTCGNYLEFNVEDMELLAGLADETSKCQQCWEQSDEFKHLAA